MMLMLFVGFLAVAQSAPPTIAQAGWLTGCWSLTRAGRTVTEHWLPPDGGTMIGVSRTVSGGRTTEYEFLLIREGDKGLEYVAKPSGQAETVFASTRVGPDEIVFENPDHDFPTRIAYTRQEGRLLATTSGAIDGKKRVIEFGYTAAACPR
jgi:hypothetical protein